MPPGRGSSHRRTRCSFARPARPSGRCGSGSASSSPRRSSAGTGRGSASSTGWPTRPDPARFLPDSHANPHGIPGLGCQGAPIRRPLWGMPASQGGIPRRGTGRTPRKEVASSGPPRDPAQRGRNGRTPRKEPMRLTSLLAVDPGMDRIVSILDGLRNALVAVLVTLSVVALTYAGVRYVIAGGDITGVEKAKGAAKSAVIGLALALLAPVVVAIVKRIIGE